MIAECAADLLARVRNVPELTDSSGLTIGGKTPDPGLLKKAPPFAWVLYGGMQPDEAPYGTSSQGGFGFVPDQESMLSMWRVVVYVPYNDDADLLSRFPLLEAVAISVKTSITTDPTGGIAAPSLDRWRFVSEKLALVYNDRLGYEQHYSLRVVI